MILPKKSVLSLNTNLKTLALTWFFKLNRCSLFLSSGEKDSTIINSFLSLPASIWQFFPANPPWNSTSKLERLHSSSNLIRIHCGLPYYTYYILDYVCHSKIYSQTFEERFIIKFDYLLHQNSNMFHCNYQTYTFFHKIERSYLAQNSP